MGSKSRDLRGGSDLLAVRPAPTKPLRPMRLCGESLLVERQVRGLGARTDLLLDLLDEGLRDEAVAVFVIHDLLDQPGLDLSRAHRAVANRGRERAPPGRHRRSEEHTSELQ